MNVLDWDNKVLGHRVVQFQKFKVFDESKALSQLEQIILKLKQDEVALVSCRLPHDSISESMILEQVGFKFIEMVLHPFIDLLSLEKFSVDKTIKIKARPT